MSTLLYPTAAELFEIEQSLLPDLTASDPVFKILPMEDVDSDLILWEQEDDYIGLQQVRSLNAEVRGVDAVGFKRYQLNPGYYGEFMDIDEAELTRRRQLGSFAQTIKIDDLVMGRQRQLLHRRLTRIKYISWTLLTTGTFSVSAQGGGVLHTDTFSLQTFNASVGWGTAATATPIADLRAVQLLSHGYSVSFGRDATVYVNRTTWNKFIGNLNASDLYGRRTQGLGTIENIDDVNKLLAGDDLPQIAIYDQGYKNDSGTWVNYIPTDVAVVVGNRLDAQPIGGYCMTRNASNPELAPGPFTAVVDSAEYGKPVPRRLQVYDCHNGGPKILFPSAIVIMDVS